MRLLFALALMPLAACSSDPGDPLTRSCAGHVVPSCLPFEYTSVRTASIEPPQLRVGDLTARATVHLEVDGCEEAPGNLMVSVAGVGSGRDGLTDASIEAFYPLLELSDDGLGADAIAGDGIIDKSTPNPFDNRAIPPNSELVVRFKPQRAGSCSGGTCIGGTCAGGIFELPYRTGSLAPPPSAGAGVP